MKQTFWRAFGWARARSISIWVLGVAGTTLGTSLIISSGPYVQSVVTAFLAGDDDTIYSGAMAQGVGDIPAFGTFLALALWWPYLLTGFAASLAMATAITRREFIASSGFLIGVGLTLIDMYPDGLGSSTLITSILCNFVAGGLLSLMFMVFLSGLGDVARHVGKDGVLAVLAWALWPVFWCFTLACLIYFSVSYVLKIPASPVSFRLDAPIKGTVARTTQAECSAREASDKSVSICGKADWAADPKRRFGVLTSFNPPKSVDVHWVGGGKSLAFSWASVVPSHMRSVEVRLVQGCSEPEKLSAQLKTAPAFSFLASDMKITANDGLSEFRIIDAEPSETVTVRDVGDEVQYPFWITPSDKDPLKLDVQRFVNDGVIGVSGGKNKFALSFYPFSTTDSSGLRPRDLELSYGGQKKIHFNISYQIKDRPAEATLKCGVIPYKKTSDSYVLVASEPVVGILITVAPDQKAWLDTLDHDDTASLAGGSGWVLASGLSRADVIRTASAGRLGMLSAFGAIKDVDVSGKQVQTGATGTIQASGHLHVRTDETSLLVSGTADVVILNDRRITPTRWEDLDVALKVALLVGIPAALIFLFTRVRAAFRRPVGPVWRLPG